MTSPTIDSKSLFVSLITPSEDSPQFQAVVEAHWEELAALVDSTPISIAAFARYMSSSVDILGYEKNLSRKPNLHLPETRQLRLAFACLLVYSRHYQALPIYCLDHLKIRYPGIEIPDTLSSAELRSITHHASISHLLVQVMPANRTRRVILELSSRLSEGRDAKRVMGGGAKSLTLVRDKIIQAEGGVTVQARASRGQKRSSSSDEDGGETSHEDSNSDDSYVSGVAWRRKRSCVAPSPIQANTFTECCEIVPQGAAYPIQANTSTECCQSVPQGNQPTSVYPCFLVSHGAVSVLYPSYSSEPLQHSCQSFHQYQPQPTSLSHLHLPYELQYASQPAYQSTHVHAIFPNAAGAPPSQAPPSQAPPSHTDCHDQNHVDSECSDTADISQQQEASMRDDVDDFEELIKSLFD